MTNVSTTLAKIIMEPTFSIKSVAEAKVAITKGSPSASPNKPTRDTAFERSGWALRGGSGACNQIARFFVRRSFGDLRQVWVHYALIAFVVA
ncbi:hypothetical protein SPRG_11170 [Saprolegnia parasitica CBS 223.65]|uniref:Uncharacterized protein n=1 Tax=Saprolegnia parasitica (strain CBS 223.65) TaxID=695850 RepID=A0A067C9P0_SAPPC|nr:hypothetical protein SPRG_11170 [Saprolegnia parasitica CBS 223.65]KDO23241.1 hypothetical protein SPRG_11170 [Saprolegnia parasitica CBS 223.65]|eukprot:XP_012206032.1 hypothetical protein SPRG_11170 [Saprolegnia parasitica CBS 223.65]